MPELPEVQTIVQGLKRSIPRTPLRRVALGRTKKFRPREITTLTGSKLVRITRRGKNILIWFDHGQCLLIHLGMTGQLFWAGPSHRPDRHTHLRLEFARSDQVLHFRDVRRFGQLRLYPSKAHLAADPRMAKLGPEPLRISLPRFKKLLSRRRMIKALLLDQSVIVGFGNIYTDEALFAARIHPAQLACRLNALAVARLYRAMNRIFKQAILAGGSTIRDFRQSDGAPGKFQTRLKVYQKTGKKCTRCPAKIERLIIAGRSTHICPACQPLDSSNLRW